MYRTRGLGLAAAAALVCCLTFSGSSAFGQRAGLGRRAVPGLDSPLPAATSPSPAAEPLRTAADRPIHIRDLRLDLRVDLPGKTVRSEATLQFRGVWPTRSVSLDAVGFEVQQVTLAQEKQPAAPVHYTHDGKKLLVDLGCCWPAGQEGTLHIAYRVHDPKDGLHFFAPSKTEPEAPLSVWSQGEPVSNRYWIPCFDEPDQRQTTEVVATVPAGFEAVSNGKLCTRRENPGDKTVTFDWRQDKPHPSYLVTLVVGQFDVVREEWEGIPVLYYVPRGHKGEVPFTFAHTRAMLSYFSRRFGIRYPWAKYAQVVVFQFGGGMENTSATTMTDRILLDERSLRDRSSDSIISHELAHQWWGDMVTCRDWSHLWLNEGFASYAEALWDEYSKGRDEYAYNLYRKAAGAIAGGRTRPIMDRHYPSPGSMFDGRSYPKGAWVLHMLRHRLGDEAFWNGLKRYGCEHQFQSTETMDFRRSLEHATGRDLERFFYDWLERPGNPSLDVTTEYLPDSQQAQVVVKQTQAGEAFHLPLKLVLYSLGTAAPAVVEQEMTAKELTLRVPLPGPLARVDVDPDQAVLAEIKETKSADLWRAQLLQAPDVPARIRAAQHLAQSKTDADRQLLARAFAAEKFWAVQVELASALGRAGGSVCRDTLLQGLHHADARVRRACVENLGRFQAAPVAAVLKEILHKGDPSYAVEGAALTAYARQGQPDAVAVLVPWLSKPSHNDTLRSSALAALGTTRDPAALPTLLGWAQPGKPSSTRTAALRALTQVARSQKLNDDQRREILKVLTGALETDDRFLRFSVLSALPDLGPLASSALPTLDQIIRDQPEGRLRTMAQRIADRIRASARETPTLASTELRQLREEVQRLERQQEQLRQRLDRYEKTERKAK